MEIGPNLAETLQVIAIVAVVAITLWRIVKRS